jgi:hypothetical protein
MCCAGVWIYCAVALSGEANAVGVPSGFSGVANRWQFVASKVDVFF